MTSDIYRNLVEHKMKAFRVHFQDQSKDLFWDSNKNKLIHSAEFGRYREELCAELLGQFTPKHISYSTGFVVTPQNRVSTQCDLVLFDKEMTPALDDGNLNYFYPVDNVIGVGEVKSNINSRKELEKILIKLSSTKALSADRSKESGALNGNEFHHELEANDIFTFIICNKISFDLSGLSDELDDMYSRNGIPRRYRHNLIYSLDDGLIAYKLGDKSGDICSFPILKNTNSIFFHKKGVGIEVDRVFLSALYTPLTYIQRLCVNLQDYL